MLRNAVGGQCPENGRCGVTVISIDQYIKAIAGMQVGNISCTGKTSCQQAGQFGAGCNFTCIAIDTVLPELPVCLDLCQGTVFFSRLHVLAIIGNVSNGFFTATME